MKNDLNQLESMEQSSANNNPTKESPKSNTPVSCDESTVEITDPLVKMGKRMIWLPDISMFTLGGFIRRVTSHPGFERSDTHCLTIKSQEVYPGARFVNDLENPTEVLIVRHTTSMAH